MSKCVSILSHLLPFPPSPLQKKRKEQESFREKACPELGVKAGVLAARRRAAWGVRLWSAPGTGCRQYVGRDGPESDCGSDGNGVGNKRTMGFYS